MGDKLLVRLYYVGVGDCIYVRIPDGEDGFHILIDCGSLGDEELLEAAVNDLKTQLPEIEGSENKRLDLLVATHKHKDHIRGFDPEYFEGIKIENIWLSAVMNSDHPQAQLTNSLHLMAKDMLKSFIDSGRPLSPGLLEFAALNNDDAVASLKEDLPAASDIIPTYVHAGMSNESPEIDITFDDSETRIDILGPEENIDFFYLGDDGAQTLAGINDFGAFFKPRAKKVENVKPHNISSADFEVLRSRVLANPLAFAESDSSIQNNCSVVLLITWKGKRLLFVGDAEWHGEYKDGKHNGSWNVMWNKRKELLNAPIDFLKIGHHGSVNATPFRGDRGPDYEVNEILDAILPMPEDGEEPTAVAVASTLRANYKTVPNPELLVELGKRVSNTKVYADLVDEDDVPKFENEKGLLDEPQPIRTGLENIIQEQAGGEIINFVDIEIEAPIGDNSDADSDDDSDGDSDGD